LASAELRQQHREHGRCFSLTAKRLADFLQTAAADEALIAQRMRDAEYAVAQLATESSSPLDGPALLELESGVAGGAGQDDALIEEAIYPAYLLE
jgi:hypothetical protein